MIYHISISTPEGFDWMIILGHDKIFTQDEFDNICEEAFIYALKKQKEIEGNYFVFALDTKIMIDYLIIKGFYHIDKMYYDLEPYWSLDSIKSLELKKMLEER